MRSSLVALTLAFGIIGSAEAALSSIYVPGEIREGIYIRPHFVAAPNKKFESWSTDPSAEHEADQQELRDPSQLPHGTPDRPGEDS